MIFSSECSSPSIVHWFSTLTHSSSLVLLCFYRIVTIKSGDDDNFALASKLIDHDLSMDNISLSYLVGMATKAESSKLVLELV